MQATELDRDGLGGDAVHELVQSRVLTIQGRRRENAQQTISNTYIPASQIDETLEAEIMSNTGIHGNTATSPEPS